MLVESRREDSFHSILLNDFYTIPELIEEEIVQYIGQRNQCLYLRPLRTFNACINDRVRKLVASETLMIQLGEHGQREFEEWINAR